ncbi:MAG TPA: hypothetical protein VFJ58_17865 [Armatimonadota bacterium]|nr:hypothetical protein [Armatimonadota bacterium]
MNALRTTIEEIYGLFVDDGSYALLILVWLAVAALGFGRAPGGASWGGPVFFLGLAALLLENVIRSARKIAQERAGQSL